MHVAIGPSLSSAWIIAGHQQRNDAMLAVRRRCAAPPADVRIEDAQSTLGRHRVEVVQPVA
jgi:hypothetical protein